MTLMTQSALCDLPRGNWRGDALAQLSRRLSPPSPFPCVFSQNAFKRSLLLFSFVEDSSEAALTAAATDLMEYIRISREWDGNLNTAHPLLMVFSRAAVASDDLSDYHAFGWRVLQHWHGLDPRPWPHEVGRDPHLPFWSMCFDGMQLFVNMSCPAHAVRRSRVLGDHFVLVINPRERFDIVAGDTPEERKVRRNIRQRIELYDGASHCLQLGSYEAGEIEWWQYGIIERNEERTDRCPFHVVQKEHRDEAGVRRV